MQILHDGNLGVNTIIKQTSSDRSHVINVLKFLHKAGLVASPKSAQGKIKPINLTDIGKMTADMIFNVEEYVRSLSNLYEAMRQRFDIPHIREDVTGPTKDRIHTEVSLRRILNTRGWSEEEVNRLFYDKYEPPAGILHVLEQSPSVVINILFYRYQMFLEMNINKIGKEIIQPIIILLISSILQCFQETGLNRNIDINSTRDHNCELVMDHTIPVMSNGGFMYEFMNEEMTQVLHSMFSIVNPRKEFIKKSINTRLETASAIVASTTADRDGVEFYRRQSVSRAIPCYKKIATNFT